MGSDAGVSVEPGQGTVNGERSFPLPSPASNETEQARIARWVARLERFQAHVDGNASRVRAALLAMVMRALPLLVREPAARHAAFGAFGYAHAIATHLADGCGSSRDALQIHAELRHLEALASPDDDGLGAAYASIAHTVITAPAWADVARAIDAIGDALAELDTWELAEDEPRDEAQRAMVAARVATLRAHRPGTASIDAVRQDEAAAQLNVGRASVQRASIFDDRPNARRLFDELTEIESERGESRARDGFIYALRNSVHTMWWAKTEERAAAYGLAGIAAELACLHSAGDLKRADLAEMAELRGFLEAPLEGDNTVIGRVADMLTSAIFDGDWRGVVRDAIALNEELGGTEDDAQESFTTAVIEGLADWRGEPSTGAR